MGMALMGTGVATGDGAAAEAARMAISSPLLEDISIHGAKGVLINITGGPSMTLHDAHEAVSLIQEESENDANIIFGTVVDPELGDEVRITVIATGFGTTNAYGGEPVKQSSVAPNMDQWQYKQPADNHSVVKKDNYDLPITARTKQTQEVPHINDISEGYYKKEAPAEADNNSRQQHYKVMTPNGSFVYEDDDYDIPAFLRNQAD